MAANVNETSAATAAKTVKKSDGKFKKFLKYCKKNPGFTLGLFIMLLIVVVAVSLSRLPPMILR